MSIEEKANTYDLALNKAKTLLSNVYPLLSLHFTSSISTSFILYSSVF